MECDKCIHKSVCWMRKQGTVDVLEKLDHCCCYVEVNDPDDFIIKGDIDFIATQPVIKAVKVEYTHVTYSPNIQVKAIPIKSQTLCKNCYFNMREHCQIRQNRSCEGCSMNITDHPYCECLKIKLGKPCRHFKRREGDDNV